MCSLPAFVELESLSLKVTQNWTTNSLHAFAVKAIDLPCHEEKFLLIIGQLLGQHKLAAGPNGANPFDTQELFDGSRLKPFEECLALLETDFQRRGRDSNPRQELPPVTP